MKKGMVYLDDTLIPIDYLMINAALSNYLK
jgi:hypothetical protein